MVTNITPCGGPACDAEASVSRARYSIDACLAPQEPIDWERVQSKLLSLGPEGCASPSRAACFVSTMDDPIGRLLLAKVLSRNPPLSVVQTLLSVFPDSLSHNPAAFFTACRHTNPEVVSCMMRHILRNFDEARDECPYPWIVSEYISVEGAEAILRTYPKGVLMSSSFLESHNLVDFFLLSPAMVGRRAFDLRLWKKFKLILMAAECAQSKKCCKGHGVCPVQIILKRVCSCPDFWTSPQLTQHVLWILHQLRCTDLWVFRKKNSEGSFPIHDVLRHKCTTDKAGLVAARAVVQLLLEAHPESAGSPCNRGKLPLHMAVENSWPCHDLILVAHPDSLHTRDKQTALFPFQCAARQCSESESDQASPISLDVVFELLKANPTLLATVTEEENGMSIGTEA